MEQSKRFSRRDVLRATVALPIFAGTTGLVLSACGGKKELVCTDTTGLAAADVQMRQMQEYVDVSTLPDKNCAGCNFYNVAPAEGACGSCTVLKGPVSPTGNCKLWVKKVG